MALRALAVVLLAVTIIPKVIVVANLIAKPRQMVVNIVYDFVDDGNATHTENPTAKPTGTVPPGTTVTVPPATATASSKETPASVSTATPAGSTTPGDGEFHCTSEGTFADPKDCKSFYRCNKDLKATHDKCMFGLGHFDPATQGCSFGGC